MLIVILLLGEQELFVFHLIFMKKVTFFNILYLSYQVSHLKNLPTSWEKQNYPQNDSQLYTYPNFIRKELIGIIFQEQCSFKGGIYAAS